MPKSFSYAKEKYYFNIKNAGPSSIIIYRNSKMEAALSFHSYLKVGKQCEWLGCWNGKKFEDTGIPEID